MYDACVFSNFFELNGAKGTREGAVAGALQLRWSVHGELS